MTLAGVVALALAGVLALVELRVAWHRRRARRHLTSGRSPATAALPRPAGRWWWGLVEARTSQAARRWVQVGRDRALGRPPLALVPLLDALARSLRSGAAVGPALAEAGGAVAEHRRTATEVGGVVAEVGRGRPVAEALERWADRRPEPGLRLLAAAVALGQQAGGDVARAVDAVAATERQRLATRHEVRAQAAQARLSAVVVAGAPVGFTALATTADPRVGALLLGSPRGWALALGGLALDVVGLAWMVRITRAAA